MRGEELKGYLAGMRHAATLVGNDAVKAKAEGWALSDAIYKRLKESSWGVVFAAQRIEAEHKERGVAAE